MRVRFSIRGLMIAVAVAAGLAWVGRQRFEVSAWPLIAIWITVIGLTIWGIDQYDRENNPERKMRPILLLLIMAMVAILGLVLLVPLSRSNRFR